MSLNMTQALILLLKCTLAANLGLHLIIFVTHPANQIGYEVESKVDEDGVLTLPDDLLRLLGGLKEMY